MFLAKFLNCAVVVLKHQVSNLVTQVRVGINLCSQMQTSSNILRRGSQVAIHIVMSKAKSLKLLKNSSQVSCTVTDVTFLACCNDLDVVLEVD